MVNNPDLFTHLSISIQPGLEFSFFPYLPACTTAQIKAIDVSSEKGCIFLHN